MGRLSQALGHRVYLDANIVVYAVQGFDQHAHVVQALLEEMDAGRITAVTSVLTLAEVLVKPKQDLDQALEYAFRRFLRPSSALSVVAVTEDIAEAAAAIRAEARVKLPDAIHIATASLEHCTSFLTNDRSLQSLPRANAVLLSSLAAP